MPSVAVIGLGRIGLPLAISFADRGLTVLGVDKDADRLQAVRARRDTDCLERSLSDLREAAATERNLMYPLIECARAGGSEGEIVESLQQVFGTYTETPVF